MKTLIKALVIIITLGIFYSPEKANAQFAVSFQVFYDGLSPYGQWMNDPGYGYVWVPDAGPDFVPYSTAGHWDYTDYGWTWVSDYDWGWAPFHYGRWAYDEDYGWVWIPGNEWAPAWVAWRECDGYYGWAPLCPGYTDVDYYPASYWVFVENRYLGDPDICRHYQPGRYNNRFIRDSYTINYSGNNGLTNYYTGPRRADVERVTGRSVNLYTMNDRSRPGQSVTRGAINMYRPVVAANTRTNYNVAPANVKPYRQNVQSANTFGRPVPQQTYSQPANTNRSYSNVYHNRSREGQTPVVNNYQRTYTQPDNRVYRQPPAYRQQPAQQTERRETAQQPAQQYYRQPVQQPQYRNSAPQIASRAPVNIPVGGRRGR